MWETLLFSRNGSNVRRHEVRCRRVSEALNSLGVQVAAEEVELAIRQATSWLLQVWERNEDISHVEQLELLLKFLPNESLSLRNKWIEKLSLAYVTPFFEVPPYLNPQTHVVLENLKKTEKRIGLICNTGLTPGFALRRFLDSEGVIDHFDFLGFSDEIGYRKPDIRVFHLAAQKLGVEPHELTHVGDNLRIDVWGAQAAGLRAVLFESEKGKDRVAESDPKSLVAQSRKMGTLQKEQVEPDGKIASLDTLMSILRELERE